jgi:hypothetical protein
MIEGLDQSAWERWKAYRTAIRKPIKPASEHAMMLKLVKYGTDQDAVVNQSISNQWQGLFDLQRAKPVPGEKPVKTDKQIAAENERFAADEHRCVKGWDQRLSEPLAKLKLADALFARYMVRQDEIGHEDRIEWLRDQMAGLLREANAAKVYGDPHLRSTVWQIFGDRGVARLKERASAEQSKPNVVANMANTVHQRGAV